MYIKQFFQSNITSIYSYSIVLLHRRKVCTEHIVNMNKGERPMLSILSESVVHTVVEGLPGLSTILYI